MIATTDLRPSLSKTQPTIYLLSKNFETITILINQYVIFIQLGTKLLNKHGGKSTNGLSQTTNKLVTLNEPCRIKGKAEILHAK
jgi:hypothetical protein